MLVLGSTSSGCRLGKTKKIGILVVVLACFNAPQLGFASLFQLHPDNQAYPINFGPIQLLCIRSYSEGLCFLLLLYVGYIFPKEMGILNRPVDKSGLLCHECLQPWQHHLPINTCICSSGARLFRCPGHRLVMGLPLVPSFGPGGLGTGVDCPLSSAHCSAARVLLPCKPSSWRVTHACLMKHQATAAESGTVDLGSGAFCLSLTWHNSKGINTQAVFWARGLFSFSHGQS